MIKASLARRCLCTFSLLAMALVSNAVVAASLTGHVNRARVAVSLGQPPLKAARPAPTLIDPQDLTFIHQWLKPGQYMKTSEIKPGMVGYGLTVFQGTRVERFNIKVIGVIKKVLNGRDAVLVRMSGGPMGQSNVIKGMSGSPVYIDGKLVGAISFGYDFSKQPIAGITPIVDMLDALAPGQDRGGPIARRTTESWINASSSRSNSAGAAPQMVPLLSPVALVGFSPRAEAFLSQHLRQFGMTVSSGAAGGMDPTLVSGASRTVQPGSALSVLLTTGDFYSVVTGTATARFGSKILAFGHPFLQAGAVDFPLATAYIHEILPSLFVSFKVSSPIALAGSIVADRPWSVGAQLGRPTKMIPATFAVTDQTRNLRRIFRCQVVDHPDLTPELIASTAISAVDATHQSSGPYLARVATHIEAEGIEPIDRVDRFSTNLSAPAITDSGINFRFVADPVGSFLLRTTNQITNNSFQKASIKNVKVEITLEDGHQVARIEKVFVDRPFAAPGETVNLSCVLKPYDREPQVERLSLKIPRDMPDGNLIVAVCGGDALNAVKKRLGLTDPTPETLKQVASRILDRPRGDALVITAALPEQSLIVKGVKLVNPPAHWSRLFYSNRHTRGPALVKGELRGAKVTDWLIDGSHILTIEVRSAEKILARKPPYTVVVPAGNETIVTTEQARKAIETYRKSQSASHSSESQDSAAGQPDGSGKGAGGATLSHSAAKEYPHMRQALVWRQDTEEEFRSGKSEGTTIDSWGRMRPGFQARAEHYLPSDMQIWSGVWSKGYFWFATPDQVFRWKGDGSAPEAVAKLDGVAIPAMAADSKGVVYAASIPSGKVWAISDKEKPHVVFSTSEPIITSLCVDQQDNLYIGAAGSGKVYKLTPAREKKLLFDSQQAHVLCLFYSLPEAKLYIGTGEKGLVYCLDAAGKAEAVYQSPDHLVTGIARTAGGDLYVATAGQGHLVRVLPSGEGQILAASQAFYRLHYDPSTESVYSGDAEGDITQARVDPLSGQPYFVPICHSEQEAVPVLASDGKLRLFAATANLASVRCLEMGLATAAAYSSVIRDAGLTSRWFHLRAYGAFNEPNHLIQNQIRVETRTGETSQPDQTWSAWEEGSYKDQAFAITSPPGRYLQYRLSWRSKTGRATVAAEPEFTIGRVEVTFLPANSAPKLNSLSLKAGALVSGKQSLSLTGSDPDGDNLLLSIDLSSDQARTWKPLAGDLRAKRANKLASKAGETEAEPVKDQALGKGKTRAEKEKPEPAKTRVLEGNVEQDEEGDQFNSPEEKELRASPGSRQQMTFKRWQIRPAPHEDRQQLGAESGQSDADKGDGGEGDKDKQKSERRQDDAAKGKAKARTEPSRPADGAAARADSETPAESFSWSLDSKKFKDGAYILRFILDDRLSSPEDSLKSVSLRSLVIDNTPPLIERLSSTNNPDGTIQLRVSVTDSQTPIANATYRINDDEPFALASLSGPPDGLKAAFGVSKIKARPGSSKVEIKATDSAGNSATRTFTVK